jgi:hypothetical protein
MAVSLSPVPYTLPHAGSRWHVAQCAVIRDRADALDWDRMYVGTIAIDDA